MEGGEGARIVGWGKGRGDGDGWDGEEVGVGILPSKTYLQCVMYL